MQVFANDFSADNAKFATIGKDNHATKSVSSELFGSLFNNVLSQSSDNSNLFSISKSISDNQFSKKDLKLDNKTETKKDTEFDNSHEDKEITDNPQEVTVNPFGFIQSVEEIDFSDEVSVDEKIALSNSFTQGFEDNEANLELDLTQDEGLDDFVKKATDFLSSQNEGDDDLSSMLDEAQVKSVKLTEELPVSSDEESFSDIHETMKQRFNLETNVNKFVSFEEDSLNEGELGVEQSLELLRSQLVDIDENIEEDLEQNLMKENSLNAVFKMVDEKLTTVNKTSSSLDMGNESNEQSFNPQSILAVKGQSSKTNATTNTLATFKLMHLSANLKANAEALTEKVMEMSSKNLKNLELSLNPEGLGKMKINLEANGDDLTTISISASNESTKALVQESLSLLKENLLKNDINAQTLLTSYQEDNGNQGKEQQANQDTKQENQTLFASEEQMLESDEKKSEDNDILVDGSLSYFA